MSFQRLPITSLMKAENCSLLATIGRPCHRMVFSLAEMMLIVGTPISWYASEIQNQLNLVGLSSLVQFGELGSSLTLNFCGAEQFGYGFGRRSCWLIIVIIWAYWHWFDRLFERRWFGIAPSCVFDVISKAEFHTCKMKITDSFLNPFCWYHSSAAWENNAVFRLSMLLFLWKFLILCLIILNSWGKMNKKYYIWKSTSVRKSSQ